MFDNVKEKNITKLDRSTEINIFLNRCSKNKCFLNKIQVQTNLYFLGSNPA